VIAGENGVRRCEIGSVGEVELDDPQRFGQVSGDDQTPQR
jgi:hypothetical protein